jgi:1-acyl-sn-glycerol-3-phosphate acyltransferase
MLTGGTRDVTVAFGIPRPLAHGDDRKAMTKAAEADVRRVLVALNRGQQVPELSRAG